MQWFSHEFLSQNDYSKFLLTVILVPFIWVMDASANGMNFVLINDRQMVGFKSYFSLFPIFQHFACMVVERLVILMILMIDIHFLIIIDISSLHPTIAMPIEIIAYHSKEKTIVINSSRA